MDFEIERILLPSLTKEGSRIRPISVERFYMAQISRRYFLKSSGAAVAAYFALPSFLLGSGRDQPILIVIFQRGAADGLSMVAPFGERWSPAFSTTSMKSGNLNCTLRAWYGGPAIAAMLFSISLLSGSSFLRQASESGLICPSCRANPAFHAHGS